jgi:hypothetical protein
MKVLINDVRLKELIFPKPGIIPSIQLAPEHPRYTRLTAKMTTVSKDQNPDAEVIPFWGHHRYKIIRPSRHKHNSAGIRARSTNGLLGLLLLGLGRHEER